MESATAIVTIAPSAVIACGSWKIARRQIRSRPPIIQNFKSDAARNSRGPPACPQGRDETRKELDDTLIFIRDIDRACNPAEVCNVILKAVKPYGFTNVLAGTIPIPGSTMSQQESNIVLAQWPGGWAERYFSNGYLFVDPAIRRVTSDISPSLWSELDPFCRNDPIAARVMNEAGDFQLKSGFTVPLVTLEGDVAKTRRPKPGLPSGNGKSCNGPPPARPNGKSAKFSIFPSTPSINFFAPRA